MENAYVTALIESLEKKIDILNEIHVKDEEQLRIAGIQPVDYEAFDKNDEEKTVLIYKLNKLDDGFEQVYEKVRVELQDNKSAYAAEIRRMQELISKITELSTKIQAEEARNKLAVERAFRTERERIKSRRSGIKAIQSYAQTMRGTPPEYNAYDSNK